MVNTFIDRCLAGEISLESIDDFVKAWHEGDSAVSLPEFLGMSDEEYGRWILHADALPEILAARRRGRRRLAR